MARLLIATTNPAKFEEAESVFGAGDWQILGLKDFPQVEAVPETGETFEENAVLKAKEYFAKTGVPCIGDDGGLVVDYLDGLPGLHSKRWLGSEATDEDKARAVVERLAGVPQEKRSARLGGVIAFYDGAHLLTKENWIEGYIADRILGDIKPGFAYRVIFIVPQFGKPYSELTEEKHAEVNFRRKNLNALKPEILKLLA